jgi:hypothetical protein
MKIYCKYDELVDPKKLKEHPKNRNSHGSDQIERLANLYELNGIRQPITVSNQSGFIVFGHGRRLAAIRAGLKQFPVVYQDFESEAQEYSSVQADNAISAWSELDLAGINADLPDLGPDFDIESLGIKNFVLDLADKNFAPGFENEQGKLDEKQMTICPNCNEIFDHAKNKYVKN